MKRGSGLIDNGGSHDQISAKCCCFSQVPIVPYGGATSIEGHTLSPNGGVCIDMSLMIVRVDLNFSNSYISFPLDPGPGDNNWGNVCYTTLWFSSCEIVLLFQICKHGYHLAQVVLANRDIVKTGSRARKSAAGDCKIFVEKVELIRPNDELQFLDDTIRNALAWLSKFIVLCHRYRFY